ncbi:MAG: DHA2 family efflux MFS transporter permease subunit [Gammaproteobacteria bacterium]|jgi:DHA2 family multidrug resistance protein
MSAAVNQSQSPWLITATVMLITIMVILDMTIVNVALPHMMGALGATSDQVTWVLTAYIVASAIGIPLTGFLAKRLGRKRLMLISVSGFVVASALCGQAHSLAEMVLFRVLQGAFGASVVPLSQAVLVDTFPPEQRGKAMALWGIGIMIGPVLGPTLGGYITQHLGWRWIFYINVPVGLMNVAMISRLIPASARQRLSVDWLGAILMALGIGGLQVVLDRGNQENWFHSHWITALAMLSAAALIVFARRAWHRPDSIVPLNLLRDRNLASASLMITVFGLGLFGTIALQPLLLERLLGYSAETTGLVMAPRGLSSAVGMFLVARFINKLGAKRFILMGLTLAALGTYAMTFYNLTISPAWIIWPSAIQGLGMGMVFVPLSTLAYQTLPASATDHAAGIYNLSRTIGSSVGISIVSTLLSRNAQTNWNQLGGHINGFNPSLYDWLGSQGMQLSDPLAAPLLAQELERQASMLAFINVFWFVTLSFLILAPLVFLMAKGRNTGPNRSRVPH